MKNIYKLIVTLCAVLMLAACSTTGGGQWPSKTDAVTLVQKAQEAQP